MFMLAVLMTPNQDIAEYKASNRRRGLSISLCSKLRNIVNSSRARRVYEGTVDFSLSNLPSISRTRNLKNLEPRTSIGWNRVRGTAEELMKNSGRVFQKSRDV